MAKLAPMPTIMVSTADLAAFGQTWQVTPIPGSARKGRPKLGALGDKAPHSGALLGGLFDAAIADSLALMLGDIPIVTPNQRALTPPPPDVIAAAMTAKTGVKQRRPNPLQDCVELGHVRIIGGVRPQNFDVGYRPDGIRFAHDSKTLNDVESIGKNYQNMINDLATEATTVHSRFPYALVTFMVVLPEPSLVEPHRSAIVGTLERLARRDMMNDPAHLAEAIGMVVWDPYTGNIDASIPEPGSPIRIENFSVRVESIYLSRYKGLPPHAA